MKKLIISSLITLMFAMPALACCCPQGDRDSQALESGHAHHHAVGNHDNDKHPDNCEKADLQVTAKPASLPSIEFKTKLQLDPAVAISRLPSSIIANNQLQNDPPYRSLLIVSSTPLFLSTNRLRI